MYIEWNKVTWYSKVLAIILFVATFCIGFKLGERKAIIDDINKNTQTLMNSIENK
ncbi:MAG: hypothetical protein WCP17_03625 [bacterium]